MGKLVKKIVITVTLVVTLFGAGFAQPEPVVQTGAEIQTGSVVPAKEFDRGIEAIKDIVAARDAFKRALDDLSKESKDVKGLRDRLERIIKQISVVFPQGDEDLQARIEMVLARIFYLENEKEHIEKNYWQVSKPLVALCVVGAVGATVGGWFLLRGFMKREEAAYQKEIENNRERRALVEMSGRRQAEREGRQEEGE